ncbi:hypothetical protein ACFYPT_12965 [Streptomyces sp. NPDC005529]
MYRSGTASHQEPSTLWNGGGLFDDLRKGSASGRSARLTAGPA